MKRVIVTGANGFIGAALVKELLGECEVYAVIHKNTERLKALPQKRLYTIYCDFEQICALPQWIQIHGFDAFYHFAWSGTSGPGRSDYNLQMQNVCHTCEAVKAAKMLECKKFIFAGSIMEYESALYVLEEGSQPAPSYFYSIAKRTAHEMAKILAVQLKIAFTAAIISNVYGEGETAPRFINQVLKQMLAHEQVKCTKGDQLYDFLYITDAAKAFVLLGKKEAQREIVYIGNSTPRQLKEFIMEMAQCVGGNLFPQLGALPYQGPYLTYQEFDRYVLETQYGFLPEVSFTEGIMRIICYFKQTKNEGESNAAFFV